VLGLKETWIVFRTWVSYYALLWTLAGAILAFSLPQSVLVSLGALGLWSLLGFFIIVFVTSPSNRMFRSILLLSFGGGYGLLLVSVLSPISPFQILPAPSCDYWSFAFTCTEGTPVQLYYGTLNALAIAGAAAVCASLLYGVSPRTHRLLGTVLLATAAVCVWIVSSIRLVVLPLFVIGSSIGLGGLLMAVCRPAGQTGFSQKTFSRVIGILKGEGLLLLLVITPGAFSAIWAYSSETVGSLQVVCYREPDYVAGVWSDAVVGVDNPTTLPLKASWKVTYEFDTFNGSRFAVSDQEFFQIPPKSTVYPHFHFAFGSLEDVKGIASILYERHYEVMLWSFIRSDKGIISHGPEFHGPLCPA